MKYSPSDALAAGKRRLLKLPFYEVAGTVNFTAESACCTAPMPNPKRISKAGSVRHTSTDFFVVWKSSAGIFPRKIIHT
jgi:hypothetical protein